MKRPALILGDREVTTDADRPPWHRTHGTYLAGRAAIDEADAAAIQAERTWGVGRLRLLVSTELRERFDRQRYKFNAAVWHGDLEDVKREAGRMATAWRALDAAARKADASAVDPIFWEVGLSDGSVAVITRSNVEAHALVREDRKCRVYTLAEIGRLLEAVPAVLAAKEVWPGATVTAWRTTDVSDPLDGVDDTRGGLEDEVPF